MVQKLLKLPPTKQIMDLHLAQVPGSTIDLQDSTGSLMGDSDDTKVLMSHARLSANVLTHAQQTRRHI